MWPGASPEWLSSRKSLVKAVMSAKNVPGTFISGRLPLAANVSDGWQTASPDIGAAGPVLRLRGAIRKVAAQARTPHDSRKPPSDADVGYGPRKLTSVIADPISGLWGVDWHGAHVL